MTTRQAIADYIRQWVKEALPDYRNFNDLLKQGFCADLADLVWRKFPDVKFHSTGNHGGTPVHTWVSFGGYHFDMQNPEGVADWKQMLYFKNCENPVMDEA